MLVLECERTVGGGYFHDVVLLAPGFRSQLIVRDRLLYDTSFTARIPSSPELAHLMVVTHGSFRVGGTTHAEPVAYLMTDAEFNASDARELGFRSWGSPNITLELAVPARELARAVGLRHGPVELSAATWDAAHVVADAIGNRTEAGSIDAAFSAFLAHLVDTRLTTADVAADANAPIGDDVARLWPVVRERYASMAVSTNLLEVASEAGVSLAQAARDFGALLRTFPHVGTGFRDIMRLLRLRLAAQFLSGPTATVREVAGAVGYGSATAMRRAFHDAGMLTPSAIVAACRYPG